MLRGGPPQILILLPLFMVSAFALVGWAMVIGVAERTSTMAAVEMALMVLEEDPSIPMKEVFTRRAMVTLMKFTGSLERDTPEGAAVVPVKSSVTVSAALVPNPLYLAYAQGAMGSVFVT